MVSFPPSGDFRTVQIRAVAQALGLQLQGSNIPCQLNPAAHKDGDRHPSMVLSGRTNRFRCYGCSASGDVVDLVRAVKQCSFKEAQVWLQRLVKAGCELFTDSGYQSSWGGSGELLELRKRLLEEALKTPQSDLPPEVKEYLHGRGVDPGVAFAHGVRAVNIGSMSKIDDWLHERMAQEELASLGLMGKFGTWLKAYPIMWRYLQGGVAVYLQMRTMKPDVRPKERSITGQVPCLWNVDCLADHPEKVYVCEGVLDALTLLSRGFLAVAVPGAGMVSRRLLEPLCAAEEVFLAFDGDPAGRDATRRAISIFRGLGKPVRALHLPDGQDVNDYFGVKK